MRATTTLYWSTRVTLRWTVKAIYKPQKLIQTSAAATTNAVSKRQIRLTRNLSIGLGRRKYPALKTQMVSLLTVLELARPIN